MFKYIVVLSMSMLMFSCEGTKAPKKEGSIYLYDSNFRTAYNEGDRTLSDSAADLSTLGIEVLTSTCARLYNIFLTEALGDFTGEFFVHEIRIENAPDVEGSDYGFLDELGDYDFPSRYSIQDGGISYDFSECSKESS